MSPWLGSHSIKSECLFKLILIGPAMLRRALHEFVAHYHHERPHQGCGNELMRAIGLACLPLAVSIGDIAWAASSATIIDERVDDPDGPVGSGKNKH